MPRLQFTSTSNACACCSVDLDTELEADGLVQMEPETKTKGSSIAASVFNLTNTIIGAGAPNLTLFNIHYQQKAMQVPLYMDA